MKSFMKLFWNTFIVLLIVFSPVGVKKASSGAWMQKKGALYVEEKQTRYTTKSEFSSGGSRKRFSDNGKFTKDEINIYFEYGLTDRVNLIGNFFYEWFEFENDFGKIKNDGFGQNELGVRYLLKHGDYYFSGQTLVAFPLDNGDEGPLIIHNGQVDLEQKFMLSRGFDNHIFTNLELGFRKRFEEPGDQIRTSALIGYNGLMPWEFVVEYNGTYAVGSSSPTLLPEFNIVRENEFDLHKISFITIYNVSQRFGLKLELFNQFAGENTGAEGGVTGGFFIRF